MRRAARPCPEPGCPHLTDQPKGCAAHRSSGDARRTGYGGIWRAFSAGYLRAHPVCEHCRRRPARGVHHPQSLALAPNRPPANANAMALCFDCHRMLTPTVAAHGGRVQRRSI